MSSKKHKRFYLLLDEGLPLPLAYPELNNLHNVVHVTKAKLGGVDDEAIFKFANQDKRLLVVFNTKHFRPMISLELETVSVIALSTNLTDKQADLKLCKALKNLKPSEAKGCLISITNQNITIKRVV